MIGQVAAVLLGAVCIGACAGTNDLDPSAPAVYLEPRAQPATADTAALRRATTGLPRCPIPAATTTLDSSVTVVLEGTPRLAVRLPQGFRVSGARLPTPTMQRVDGPGGARILIERDPTLIVAFGPAYGEVTESTRLTCWQASQGSRVPAQVQSFTPRAEGVVTPTVIVGASVNVFTLVVGTTPLSLAVYARTPEERTALVTLATRLRGAP